MKDAQVFGAVAALLVFFLSGSISPIDQDRPWTFFRWMLVFLLMLAGVVALTSWLYGVPLR